MVYVLEVDGRGRVVIPKEVRERLKVGRRVRLRVEGGKMILEVAEDPLDRLTSLVRGSKVSSAEAGEVGRLASRLLMEEGGRGDPHRD